MFKAFARLSAISVISALSNSAIAGGSITAIQTDDEYARRFGATVSEAMFGSAIDELEQRRREEEAERLRQAAEVALLQRLIQDEQEAAENARQDQEAANSFINNLRRFVDAAWELPESASSDMRAAVSVSLTPSGAVESVTVTSSSGNEAFDRSALAAVLASSPFPEIRQLPLDVKRDYMQFTLRFSHPNRRSRRHIQ